MKIAISAQGKDLESLVDPRFGRAAGFIIYDDQTQDFEYVDNQQNLNAPQGAGIQSAKNVIDAKVDLLISGNVGPKAFAVLKKAQVKIMIGATGTIKESLQKYKDGLLTEAQSANVEGHW